jgi:hypothetical protein
MKNRRGWWRWIASPAIPASAIARNAPSLFAPPSLPGDQFTVASRKDEIGSRLDQNTQPRCLAVHSKSVVLAWDALIAKKVAARQRNPRCAVGAETTAVLAV